MTRIQMVHPNHITQREAGKQKMQIAEVVPLALLFEKSTSEPKNNFLRFKNFVNTAISNDRTLYPVKQQQPELTETAVEHNKDICSRVCIYYHNEQVLKHNDTING